MTDKEYQDKKRDIRFKCANYDFKSGHCKAFAMFYNDEFKTDENGEIKPVDIYCHPIGCSGDPKCEKFKAK